MRKKISVLINYNTLTYPGRPRKHSLGALISVTRDSRWFEEMSPAVYRCRLITKTGPSSDISAVRVSRILSYDMAHLQLHLLEEMHEIKIPFHPNHVVQHLRFSYTYMFNECNRRLVAHVGAMATAISFHSLRSLQSKCYNRTNKGLFFRNAFRVDATHLPSVHCSRYSHWSVQCPVQVRLIASKWDCSQLTSDQRLNRTLAHLWIWRWYDRHRQYRSRLMPL